MSICVFWQVRCICYKQTGSSPQHLGFRGYLEYYECCIFYFVIQLFGEPDRQNVAGLFRRQLILCFCSVTPQLCYKCELSSAIVKAVLHHFHVLNFCTQSLQKLRTTSVHWSFVLSFSKFNFSFNKAYIILKYFTPRKGCKLNDNTTVSKELKFLFELKTCNSKRWPQLSLLKNENVGWNLHFIKQQVCLN